MPIARNPAQHNHNWIPREAETEFQNLLNDGTAYVVPLVGVGGAGKTSLLRRFFSYCEYNDIPALYIDLPRLTVVGALEMWLRVETVHTKTFDEHRKKLNTGYETLSAMLQAYGDNASNAAELLQKSAGNDESLGLVIGAVKDIGKVAYQFWQRKENRQQQALLQRPEEALLRALAKDFQKHGVILIDTLEQAGKQNLSTRLRFRDDGELETPAAEHPRTANLIEYCAGMAHFLFDKPVIMVLAGRPPAIRELGALPLDYFAPTVDVPAFTADEIRTYLESSLPRQIAPPQDSDISKLQQLTLGNPFLLERVVRLLADWQPTWEWKAEQWQPLLNSFQQDERHGLLLYVTQRLLTHVLPDDHAFWRLALPRQYIHRDMAELLFPKDEFSEQSGLQRLNLYEEKGTIYREQDPDRYFLHDETRAAFTAWAKREKVWLDKATCEIHARLSESIKAEIHWPEISNKCIAWNTTDRKEPIPPEFGNPLLLECAYHSLMADDDFEQRHPKHNRQDFWDSLSVSLSSSNIEKMVFVEISLTRPLDTTFFRGFDIEIKNFGTQLEYNTHRWLEKQSKNGKLPSDWSSNERFLTNAIRLFPESASLIGSLAAIMHSIHKDYARAESLYQQALDVNPNHAINLGNFALFLYEIRTDYDSAETLFQQAIDTDSSDATTLGNFAYFLWQIRKDFNRAEALFQQAINANPSDANTPGNFAIFMTNIRKDFDHAKILYQQAIDADPTNAYWLGGFAYFMQYTCKDFDRAEALYQQAIDADPTNAYNLGNFAYFLWHSRKNFDRTEILFQQAIDADPSDATTLSNFASFLHFYRKNYSQAKQFYQRALKIDSTEAYYIQNLAQLYLLEGDKTQGKALINQAFATNPESAAIKLELWFYRLAHFPQDYPQAQTEIMALLETGARSEGWDFSGNIAQAEKDGHPNIALLRALADTITQQTSEPQASIL